MRPRILKKSSEMKRTSSILVLFLSIFAIHSASAQTFTCGQTMVETEMGTTKEEVLDKCGPPTEQGADRWYYKNQPGQVTVVLTFEAGTLQQIDQIPE